MRSRSIALLLALLPASSFAQTLAEQVLERTNAARWDNGQLPPLKGHVQLDASAVLHSTNMGVRDFFMHCDPDTGKSHSTRMSDAGYAWSSAGENIAAGSDSAAGVMSQWLNSPGHLANILSTSYNELGVGYYFDASDAAPKRHTTVGGSCTPNNTLNGAFRHYWTQNFGRRSSGYPLVVARDAYQTASCNIDLYVYGAGFATQMRFSNTAGATWSAWQAYNANTVWNLVGVAGGIATVQAEIRNGSGTVRSASDSIRLSANCGSGGADPMLVFEHGFEG